MTMRLTRRQFRDGYVGQDDKFAEWFVEEIMKDLLPEYYLNISHEGKREMVINGRRYAREFGLKDPEAQAHFIRLMWMIGANFYTFPGFRDVLARDDLQDMERIDSFFDGTVSEQEAVQAIMKADESYWFRDDLEG